jgi:hypothetical protein
MVSPMYALRLHDRSQALNLVYEQAPEPLVGIGDALVRVHARELHADRDPLAMHLG